MGHAAAALLIIGQPLAVLATVLLPPTAMARTAAPRTAVALWALSLALLVAWGVSTYQAGVRADEAGTEGDLLGTVHWLGLAVCAAFLSLLVVRRSSGDRAG